MDSSTTEPVRFEPWLSRFDGITKVQSAYARLGWLPTIGPSSYLIWETLATQLHRNDSVTWNLEDLAAAHGLNGGTGRHCAVRRTLERLQMFRILNPRPDGSCQILIWAPPLSSRSIQRLRPQIAGPVNELHRRLFIVPTPQTG